MSPSAAYCPYWGWSGHKYDLNLLCKCGHTPNIDEIQELTPETVDAAVEERGIE